MPLLLLAASLFAFFIGFLGFIVFLQLCWRLAGLPFRGALALATRAHAFLRSLWRRHFSTPALPPGMERRALPSRVGAAR